MFYPNVITVTRQYRVWQYGLWSFQTGDTKLERFLPKNQHKGSFNNYVDQFWPNFDPLPPSSGQAWTSYIPPPCPRGQKGQKSTPPIKYSIKFNVIWILYLHIAHKKTQALVFNHLLCTASSSQSWTKGDFSVICHNFSTSFFEIFVHVDIQWPPHSAWNGQ